MPQRPLDTLNEIAAAISDDPAFFSTMSTANTTLQNNIDTEATTTSRWLPLQQLVVSLDTIADASTGTRRCDDPGGYTTKTYVGLCLSGRLDTLEVESVTTTGTCPGSRTG